MISQFISSHPILSVHLLVLLIIIVGFLELVFLNRRVACITWFWALLIVVVNIVYSSWLGIVSWMAAIALFAIASFYLWRFYRRTPRNM
jgi:hypothetical protein